jgi:replicative DNA helicase
LAEALIWIDDNPNLTIMEIRSKARRLRSRLGDLGLVVVDYLQLMTGRSNAENRQVEVSEISRGLKILARELECPVIALSQLSRQLEMRADKRPMLADLRESGSIEQDADVVMFIYRDDVYNPDSPDRGTAELLISKHRNGPTGVVRLAFLDHYTKFANMAKGT